MEYKEIAKLLVSGLEMYRHPMEGVLPEDRGNTLPVIETGLALEGFITVPPTAHKGPTVVSLQSGVTITEALLAHWNRKNNNNKHIILIPLC